MSVLHVTLQYHLEMRDTVKLASPLQERTKSILPFHALQNTLQTLDAAHSGQRQTSGLATRDAARRMHHK
jgi:hypothetical protein